MALTIKSYIQNFLFNLSKSSPVFYYLSKKIYDIIFYYFRWYISKSEGIKSIIPCGSYRTKTFIPWQSDIDVLIITYRFDNFSDIFLQKKLCKKINLFSSFFQLIKHALIIPENIFLSEITSLIPPFYLPNNGQLSRKLHRMHSIICTEEYLNRIYFFLTSRNLKYISSAKNILNRKRRFISSESIRLLRILKQTKSDLKIIVNNYEKKLLEKVLASLRRNFTAEAFFMVYHHAYLTIKIWSVFQPPNLSMFQKRIEKFPNDAIAPLIKNFLEFANFKFLPYLKNIVHTKFICYFHNLQPQLLNHIKADNQIIPSLLDEIFILCNYSRTLLEPLDFPYGVNFDRRFNDINSYRIEHFRGIFFVLLNFESYIQDATYFLTPEGTVSEKKYTKYKRFLDKKIDLKELIDEIYKKKYDLLNQMRPFLKSSRYQKIIDQINSL